MKKTVAIIVMFVASLTYGQKEVTLDLGNALVMKTLQVSYEHYLTDQSSVGLSALFNFEERTSDLRYNEDTMITPFFRHYFTANRNWNYFGEIFLGINSGEDVVDDSEGSPSFIQKYTDGALGVSVGTKYISNGGLVVSLLGGLGRNMFTDKSPTVVPRFGVNVGYRF